MASDSRNRRQFRWIGVAVVAYGLVCWFGGGPTQAWTEKGVQPILIQNFKYVGNASCAGAECHTADKPKVQSGQLIGDEATIWAEKDPHALAFETLSSDASKTIAEGLKIGAAGQSERCLICHSINAPPAQRGEKFALNNAVGCEACHGPAEKWLEPHKKAGWTAEQRKSIGAEGLLKEYGLVDTSNLSARAHTCVACHLRIDKDMVDAGHPPLEFEMYAYNYYVSKKPDKEYKVHWGEGLEIPRFWDAKLWAAGQAAAHEASAAQVEHWKGKGWDTGDAVALEKLYAAGLEIARKHFGVDDAKSVIAVELTPAKASAAAVELAGLAPQAKGPIQRRIVAYGVAALTSSAYAEAKKQLPDKFWESYYAALGAKDEGAYKQAVEVMTGFAGAVKQ